MPQPIAAPAAFNAIRTPASRAKENTMPAAVASKPSTVCRRSAPA